MNRKLLITTVIVLAVLVTFTISYFLQPKGGLESTSAPDRLLDLPGAIDIVGGVAVYSGLVIRVRDGNFTVQTENNLVTFKYSDLTKFYDSSSDPRNPLQLSGVQINDKVDVVGVTPVRSSTALPALTVSITR